MVNSKQREPKALRWRGSAFPVYYLQRRRRDLTGRAVADFAVCRNSLQSKPPPPPKTKPRESLRGLFTSSHSDLISNRDLPGCCSLPCPSFRHWTSPVHGSPPDRAPWSPRHSCASRCPCRRSTP